MGDTKPTNNEEFYESLRLAGFSDCEIEAIEKRDILSIASEILNQFTERFTARFARSVLSVFSNGEIRTVENCAWDILKYGLEFVSTRLDRYPADIHPAIIEAMCKILPDYEIKGGVERDREQAYDEWMEFIHGKSAYEIRVLIGILRQIELRPIKQLRG